VSARPAPSVVRVKIGCPDLATYLDRHAFEYARYGLFIPSPRPEARPLGARVHLKIQLADGTFGYSGAAVVAHHVLDTARPGYLLHFAEREARVERARPAEPAPGDAAAARTPPPLPSKTAPPVSGANLAAPVASPARILGQGPAPSASPTLADLDDGFEEVTDSAILARELPRAVAAPDLLESLFGPDSEAPLAREAAPGRGRGERDPFGPASRGADAGDPFAAFPAARTPVPASSAGLPPARHTPVPGGAAVPPAAQRTPEPGSAAAPTAARRTPAPGSAAAPTAAQRTPAPGSAAAPTAARRTPAPGSAAAPSAAQRTPAPGGAAAPPAARRTPAPGGAPFASAVSVPPTLARDPFAVASAAPTPAPVRELFAALDAVAPAPRPWIATAPRSGAGEGAPLENLRAPITPAPTRGAFADEVTHPGLRHPERRESLTTMLGLGPNARRGRFKLVMFAVAVAVLSAAGMGFAVGQHRTMEAEAAFAAEIATADDRVRIGRLAAPAGDSALDHLDAARKILPGDLRLTSRGKLLADTFESLGRHALARGDLKEAAVHFTSALRAEPSRASARAQLETIARISPRRLGGTP
jgi:hypothetical protein